MALLVKNKTALGKDSKIQIQFLRCNVKSKAIYVLIKVIWPQSATLLGPLV